MTATSSRRILLPTVPNLRTLGGIPVAGGVVADGMIFRSATLGALSDEDGAALVDLGIRRVADFRTSAERASAPDVLPTQLTGVWFDVLGDQPNSIAASLTHIGMPGDPGSRELTPEETAAAVQGITDAIGGGRGVELLKESNRSFVRSASGRAAYRGFFEALTEPNDYAPTLFHCSAGKDRTGWAAASFLLLLGADEGAVMEDYMQTNSDILPMVEPMLRRAEQNGIDPEMVREVLTVQPAMLEAAHEEMRAAYGTVESYFLDGLGLPGARLDLLRERFIAAA